jgi:hypothetical protein
MDNNNGYPFIIIHYSSVSLSLSLCLRKLGAVLQPLVGISPREVCGEEILLEAFEMEALTGWPYPKSIKQLPHLISSNI